MRMKNLCCLAAILCGSAFATAAFAEQVANPAYANWAKYKVGTTVTMKTTSEMAAMPGGGMSGTNTSKLLEVTADKVVIEVTMKMTMNGQETAMPASKQEIPAKVEKGSELLPNMGPSGGKPPVVKDVKDGTDTVAVGDKKIDTVTKAFAMENAPDDANKMAGTMKTWTSAEVPGGTVKMEMNMTVPMTMKMTQTVTEFTLGK